MDENGRQNKCNGQKKHNYKQAKFCFKSMNDKKPTPRKKQEIVDCKGN